MMKLTTVHAGMFKLDGGAMFGVVPRQLWQRLNPPDEKNMCTWAMRCLLLEYGDRKILFDTGMGDKQGEKFRSHFEPHGDESLMSSIENAMLKPEEITDVFLTHLHFDHDGGAVSVDDKGHYYPTFPNARYWTNERHYKWALEPNPRERASFLKENMVPLEDAGVLNFIDVNKGVSHWIDNIDVLTVYGHTEAMMCPHIRIPSKDGDKTKTLVFAADLMPSSFHLGLPYVMAYDIRPLITLEEKSAFLSEAVANDYVIFLEHDPSTECITVMKNERGRYIVNKSGSLDDLI